jgi:nitroreductase
MQNRYNRDRFNLKLFIIFTSMGIKELITRSRSYRRFHQDASIDPETLRELIDLARLSPSGSNAQALKFILSSDSRQNALIFPHLAWAGYLRDWPGPSEGERPSAYIIILGDKDIQDSFGVDHGIAAQSIMLGAAELGLGGCMIGSINKSGLRDTLQIPGQFEILLVLALGKPNEKVVLEPADPGGDIKYWRDEKGIHHVPKRSLDELIISDTST